MHVNSEARGVRLPGARVIGGCELPTVGAENELGSPFITFHVCLCFFCHSMVFLRQCMCLYLHNFCSSPQTFRGLEFTSLVI